MKWHEVTFSWNVHISYLLMLFFQIWSLLCFWCEAVTFTGLSKTWRKGAFSHIPLHIDNFQKYTHCLKRKLVEGESPFFFFCNAIQYKNVNLRIKITAQSFSQEAKNKSGKNRFYCFPIDNREYLNLETIYQYWNSCYQKWEQLRLPLKWMILVLIIFSSLFLTSCFSSFGLLFITSFLVYV